MSRTYDTTARNVERETQAARDLLAEIASDDDDLTNDMIEGETSLLEAIDAAIAEMDECAATIAGCKDREATFAERRQRAERRQERLRGVIHQALSVCGLPGLKTATATLTVKDVPQKPIVSDESLIPAAYWRQPDPVLDKKAINDAYKNGGDDFTGIAGVTLSNGGETLQIRRK